MAETTYIVEAVILILAIGCLGILFYRSCRENAGQIVCALRRQLCQDKDVPLEKFTNMSPDDRIFVTQPGYNQVSEKRKEVNMRQLMISSLKKDFLASNLRTQLHTLQWLLNTIENSELTEQDCTVQSLKRVEVGLRRLRNFLNN